METTELLKLEISLLKDALRDAIIMIAHQQKSIEHLRRKNVPRGKLLIEHPAETVPVDNNSIIPDSCIAGLSRNLYSGSFERDSSR